MHHVDVAMNSDYPQRAASYSGQCLCGEVLFSAGASPLTMYACHCTDCRRLSGSAYSLVYIAAQSDVKVLQGQTEPFSVDLPFGRKRTGEACTQCGTRMWIRSTRVTGYLAIPAGLFVDLDLQPVAHLWGRSRMSFVKISENEKLYDSQPTHLTELVDLWREKRNQ